MGKQSKNDSEAYTEDKKYIRCKKVTVTITPKEDLDEEEKVSAENSTTTREKSHAKETINDVADINDTGNGKNEKDSSVKRHKGGKSKSKTMSATCDISVMVIDDAIIYSAKSLEIMKKNIAADNGAQPTPPYQPSEYELKRLANIKRINDYMDKKFPKTAEEKKKPIKKKPWAKVSFMHQDEITIIYKLSNNTFMKFLYITN
jgi:hypothetical protein